MTSTKDIKKASRWRLRPRERRYLLLLGDFTVAVIALFVALSFWASAAEWLGFSLAFLQLRTPLWFFTLPLFWLLLLVELYDINRAGSWGATVRGVTIAALIGLIVYLALYFAFSDPPKSLLPRRGVASFLVATSLLTLAWRYVYIRIFTAPRFMRRALLVGGGRGGQNLLRVIKGINPPPFHIIGILDDDVEKIGNEIEGYPVLAACDDLLEIAGAQGITDILVAISGEMQGMTFQTLLDAQELGVEITRMAVAYEDLLGRVPIRLLEADWILRSFVDQNRAGVFYEFGKRLLDILGGLVFTLITLLMLPFVGAAILIESGRPIFYAQVRSGKGAQHYKIIKFRTMRQDAEPDGVPQWASEDDERATRVGRILRKTHIDELPQCMNVMRGDMSLVGPRAERPELMTMFQEHVPFYRARLLVKPGITGWAQVNYGYAATVDETIVKLEYDLYYIKNRNLLMDIIILLRTPSTMFGFRGQ